MTDNPELPEHARSGVWRSVARKRGSRVPGTLTAWAVVAVLGAGAGTLGSWLGARAVSHTDAAHARLSFALSSAEVAASLKTAIEREEDLVVSARAFVLENPNASPTAFEGWLSDVQAFARYPELEDFGLVDLVPEAQLGRFRSRLAANPVKQLGSSTSSPNSGFEILPPGERPYYCFAVAGRARSLSTTLPPGLDYCALAHGLLPSLESGQSSYAPFTVTKTTSLGVQTPVYRGGVIPGTVSGRRHAFLGWLGELLMPDIVIARALVGHPNVAVTFTYHREGYNASFTAGARPGRPQSRTINLDNGWTVHAFGVEPSTAVLANANAATVLVGGTALALLIGLLLFVLGTGRTRARGLVEDKTRELSHQALHDSLTGLPNRALVLDRANSMLARSQRDEKVHVGVLFVDIDDFKQVNDLHGHLFGDRVIKETAETITSHVRSNDILGRYGGDEFVVVMPGADAPTAMHVAERVRAGIAKNGYLTTVSVGVATFDGVRKEKPSDLLHRADMNLYQAKHDGRNCVRDHCADPDSHRRKHAA